MDNFILQHIPVGYENAITRKDLCKRAGVSDRIMRKMIELACESGCVILNLQDGKGYFQPAEDELNLVYATRNIEESRMEHIATRVDALNNYINHKETMQKPCTQLTLFEVGLGRRNE